MNISEYAELSVLCATMHESRWFPVSEYPEETIDTAEMGGSCEADRREGATVASGSSNPTLYALCVAG